MTSTLSKSNARTIGITDAAAVLLIFLVPALSHLTAVPFYLADPMRLAVLGALLVTRNWKNSLALAVALPLVSFAISGHPVFPKCLVIAAELSVNVLLFAGFVRLFERARCPKNQDTLHENGDFCARSSENRDTLHSGLFFGAAAFVSILLSKVFYYGLKAAVLSAGLMEMELVSTALWIQLIVAVAISVVAGLRLRY